MSDKDDDDLIGLIGTIWLNNNNHEYCLILRSNNQPMFDLELLWADGTISTKHYLNGDIRKYSTLISNHDQSK